MKFLMILSLVTLASCGMSTEKGSYVGVLFDVSYSGIIFKSCELEFKTSEQSSKSERSSMRSSEDECGALEALVGKRFKVSYANSIFDPTIGSNYIATSLDKEE